MTLKTTILLFFFLPILASTQQCSRSFFDRSEAIYVANASYVNVNGWRYARLNYEKHWADRGALRWRVNCDSGLPYGLDCDVFRMHAYAAIRVWLENTDFPSIETPHGDNVLQISFEPELHGNSEKFFHAIAHANFRYVHLNNDKQFHWRGRTDTPNCAYNLHTILVHEIGHSLGAGHTVSSPLSIMFPTVSGDQWRDASFELTANDAELMKKFILGNAAKKTSTTTTTTRPTFNPQECLNLSAVKQSELMRRYCSKLASDRANLFLRRLDDIYRATQPRL